MVHFPHLWNSQAEIVSILNNRSEWCLQSGEFGFPQRSELSGYYCTVYGSHFLKLKGDCLCAACSMHALTFLHDILCNSQAYVSILTLTCMQKAQFLYCFFFFFLQWFAAFFTEPLCCIQKQFQWNVLNGCFRIPQH